MKRNLLLLLFCIIIAGIISSTLLFGKKFRRYDAHSINFINSKKDIVEGVIYFPSKNNSSPCPAVITIHYGLQNREALQPTSKMTAENGIAVLELILKKKRNIDGRAKTFEDYVSDANGAVDYLLKNKRIDKNLIFISGHSIGGNIASMVGDRNKKIRGVIAVGYPVSFDPNAPQGLLMTAGIFDELHQASKMLSAFEENTGKDKKGSIVINPKKIRKLIQPGKPDRIYFMSFLSDHYIEPTDPDIASAAIEYIKSYEDADYKVNNPPEGSRHSSLYYIISILTRDLLFLSVLFTFSAGFVGILYGEVFMKKIPPVLYRRICCIAVIIYILVLGFAHKQTEHLIDIYILSPIFLSLIVVNHFNRKMEKRGYGLKKQPAEAMGIFFKDAVKVLIFIAMFYFSFIVGLYFHAGVVPYSKLAYAWRTLAGIFYLIPAQFFVFCTRINGLFLKPDWSFNFLSPIVWLILIVEIIYPGGIGLAIDHFSSRIIATLQKLQFKIKFKVSIPALILLVVVLIVCAILWKQIITEGYTLGTREILGLSYLFFSLIIIPAIVSISLLRMKWIREIFDRLSIKDV
ncbi:MAG: alpha/beta hydrolase [Candidatus Eremiobacteraeota bacterium]|nr:alpha/beta hydrolase [Candidatus Eremiobacteraeota bacterium]